MTRCSPLILAALLMLLALPARGQAGAGADDFGPSSMSTAETVDEMSPETLFTDSYQPLWSKIDDPEQDGWDTEVFNEDADKQLKKLQKLILHPEMVDDENLAEVAVEDVSCAPLRPAEIRKVFEDKAIRVERGVRQGRAGEKGRTSCRGYRGLSAAIRTLVDPFFAASELHSKFKLFRVARDGESVTTTQYFALSGRTAEGMIEQNATWTIRWIPGGTGELPRIAWIGVDDFEEVSTRSQNGPLFADCTESLLGGNPSFRQQILAGYTHWLERIENIGEWAILGTPGIAVADVDGDGREDLYLCQEQGLPNRLFLQKPDGTVRDASAEAGVDWLNGCRSVLLVDLDNDGDQDLVLGMQGSLVLAANDGRGRFSIRMLLPTSNDTMSSSAVDYDNDGDLDLYITGYHPERLLEPRDRDVDADDSGETHGGGVPSFVYHDANNGARNLMFRNDTAEPGQWRFSDVTEESGLDMNNHRYSFSAVWEDYDNDGDQDLYVANDYGRDNLYRNDLGLDGVRRFTDVGDQARVENDAGGMSATWGDFDRDGFMDVFVSNMWSSAGNRVTFQPGFKPDAPKVRARLQGFARGNTLLRNTGAGVFEDMSAPAGVEMGRWAWGSRFADINNDGWEDLVVANGYLTGDPKGGDL